MLKVLKWEFIKRFHELKLFYYVLFIVMIACLMMPVDIMRYSNLIASISSLYAGLFFIIMSIYLMVVMPLDLRRRSAILEKCNTIKTWEVMGAKLINTIIYNLILVGAVKVVTIIVRRFATETTGFLTLSINKGFPLLSILLPLLIMFCYLLCDSNRFTKGFSTFATVTLVIIVLVVPLNLLPIPVLLQDLLANEIILYISQALLAMALFIGCCYLYENKFEIS